MEFKLLGMTFRLEIVLLAILLIYVINVHTICSCSKISLSFASLARSTALKGKRAGNQCCAHCQGPSSA